MNNNNTGVDFDFDYFNNSTSNTTSTNNPMFDSNNTNSSLFDPMSYNYNTTSNSTNYPTEFNTNYNNTTTNLYNSCSSSSSSFNNPNMMYYNNTTTSLNPTSTNMNYYQMSHNNNFYDSQQLQQQQRMYQNNQYQQQQQMYQQQQMMYNNTNSMRRGGGRIDWQSEGGGDVALRNATIAKIISLLQEKKPNAPTEWLQRLPDMARRLEDSLYRKAPTKEIYANLDTLKQRLQMIAQDMSKRNNSSTSTTPTSTTPTTVVVPTTARTNGNQYTTSTSNTNTSNSNSAVAAAAHRQHQQSSSMISNSNSSRVMSSSSNNSILDMPPELLETPKQNSVLTMSNNNNSMSNNSNTSTLAAARRQQQLQLQQQQQKQQQLQQQQQQQHLLQQQQRQQQQQLLLQQQQQQTPSRNMLNLFHRRAEGAISVLSTNTCRQYQEQFKQMSTSTNEGRMHVLWQQQLRLIVLRHAMICQQEVCQVTRCCEEMKALWRHMDGCRQSQQCPYSHCTSSRYVLSHFHSCRDAQCMVCQPLRHPKEIINEQTGELVLNYQDLQERLRLLKSSNKRESSAISNANEINPNNEQKKAKFTSPSTNSPNSNNVPQNPTSNPMNNSNNNAINNNLSTSSSSGVGRGSSDNSSSLPRSQQEQLNVARRRLVGNLGPQVVDWSTSFLINQTQNAKASAQQIGRQIQSLVHEFQHAENLANQQKSKNDMQQENFHRQVAQQKKIKAQQLKQRFFQFQIKYQALSEICMKRQQNEQEPKQQPIIEEKQEQLEDKIVIKQVEDKPKNEKDVSTTSTAIVEKTNNSLEGCSLLNQFTVEEIRAHIDLLVNGYCASLTLNQMKAKLAPILKTLMDHNFGWVFNSPVDPTALGIPDYFVTIRHPMDLGRASLCKNSIW